MEEKKSKVSKRCKRILAAVIGTAVVSTAVFFLSIGLRALLKSVNRGKAWNTVWEVEKVAKFDATQFVLPDAEPEERNLVMDAPGVDFRGDPAVRWYPYEARKAYIAKLRQEGYYVQEYDADFVAHKDDKTIYMEYGWQQMHLHVYVDRPTPEGGCTPEEAEAILMSNLFKGLGGSFPKLQGKSESPVRSTITRVPRLVVDVTPDGMFERTGAQIFLTFVSPFTSGTYQVQQKFFVVRYGYAYEWTGKSSLCFADVTGDGNTELCMITKAETFAAYAKPMANSLPQEYILEPGAEEIPPKYDVPVTSRSELRLDGDEVTVLGADDREYKMVVENGSLVLIDRENGRVIR